MINQLSKKFFRIYRNFIIQISVLILCGCSNHQLAAKYELSMPLLATPGILNNAASEAGLSIVALHLGSGTLMAEIASTPLQTASGLAFRTILGADQAMLFTYQTPHKVAFHMKDTLLSLSAAYIDSMGTILEIHNLEPGVEAPVVSRSDAVRFVLEVNRGWFEKHQVIIGDRVYLEK